MQAIHAVKRSGIGPQFQPPARANRCKVSCDREDPRPTPGNMLGQCVRRGASAPKKPSNANAVGLDPAAVLGLQPPTAVRIILRNGMCAIFGRRFGQIAEPKGCWSRGGNLRTTRPFQAGGLPFFADWPSRRQGKPRGKSGRNSKLPGGDFRHRPAMMFRPGVGWMQVNGALAKFVLPIAKIVRSVCRSKKDREIPPALE